MFYEWTDGDLLLRLKVQPKASKDEFCEVIENSLKVRITAPPIDGKANQHLIKFLARQFKVSKSKITLLSGETNRVKRFRISSPKLLPSFITKENR
ncbi:MAG: DUF167 family protein [Gammaproteobacteria bacterium]|nr:DUF167 family protein [Gammaproteobacteria bacterium]